MRFLPTASKSVLAGDIRLAAGTTTILTVYQNLNGAATGGTTFTTLTVTQPVSTSGAISMISSVAAAFSVIALLQ
jgi:hypothetical protein